MTTKKASERLAQALHRAGLYEMEEAARQGLYSDFTSPLDAPLMMLVEQLRSHNQHELAERAMKGEFDGE